MIHFVLHDFHLKNENQNPELGVRDKGKTFAKERE